MSSSNRGTIIPENYAVEFAPYWLVRRPALTYADYQSPSAVESTIRSFSISVATARQDSASDSTGTLVAIGARVTPLSGKPSSRFKQLDDSITTLQRARLPLIRQQGDAEDAVEEADTLLVELRKRLATTPTTSAARVAALRDSIAGTERKLAESQRSVHEAEANLEQRARTMKELVIAMGGNEADRVGHFLQFAAAFAAAYSDATIESGRFSRASVWGTYTYRMEAPKVDLIALLRYMRNVHSDGQNALETGGRLHWSRGDMGISSEWVSRTAFVTAETAPGSPLRTLTFTSSSRLVGLVEYRATDDLYATISFGQDYKYQGVDRHPLVARFGMQLSYGDKPAVVRPPPGS